MGNIHPTITPYQPVQAKDKLFIVAIGTERLWKKFISVINLGELNNDDRFKDNSSRNVNRKELITIIENKFKYNNAEHWINLLQTKEIPCGPINLVSDALNDPHIQSRNMIVDIEHPSIGMIKNLGSPIHLSDTKITYRRHPPELGEHTDEIIDEFDLIEN